uniref:Uncharacterized protein n=1 Tax=Corvus moneduloides TaxID=1196302 RepID=A0A8U7M291_CORMO
AACLLCRRTEADPDICGDKQEKHGLCAHIFCLRPRSCALPGAVGLPGEAPRLLLMGLLGSFQHCCVCGETGATITCCQEDCDRWFHLPCAKEGPSISHFARPFSPSSYCPEHCPEQDVRAIPEPGTECPICMEPVEERKSYTTLVCPACKKAWFHRDCIQVGAISACPLCRDDDEFAVQMFIMGIRIPFRLVSFWLEAEGGRRRAQPDNPELWTLCPQCHEPICFPRPWELLLCSSCAAEGTHRRCSGLRNNTPSWECDSCAGLGTGMRQRSCVALGWGQCQGWAWQSPSAPGELGAPLWPGLAQACWAPLIPASPYSPQG